MLVYNVYVCLNLHMHAHKMWTYVLTYVIHICIYNVYYIYKYVHTYMMV